MKVSGRYIITLVLLLTTLGVSALSERRRPDELAFPLDRIPRSIAGWNTVADVPLTAGVLGRLVPTSYLSRQYQKGDHQLGLFIAFYAQQRAGESMHSPKYCLPGAGWEIWKHDSVAIPVEGRRVNVNQFSIQRSGQRSLAVYWYQSRRRIIASEYLGKLYLVRDALLDGRTAGSIVRITVQDAPGAAEEASTFAAALIPEVQRCFGTY
jgi:EpsI family protein